MREVVDGESETGMAIEDAGDVDMTTRDEDGNR